MSARRELERLLTIKAGVDLSRGGLDRVLDRYLEQRRRELQLSSLDAYVELVRSPLGDELERLINATTVLYSWFFRDPRQMAALEQLLRTAPANRPLRIWVAGCATGEDAYSLALLAERAGRTVDILATDVNSHALARARAGRYARFSVRELDAATLQRFGRDARGLYCVDDRLRENVRFERHNLLDPPPPASDPSGWDLIVCRNVLIYFVRSEAARVLDRFTRALAPQGHLLLGASDVLFDLPPELSPTYVADRVIFRRGARDTALGPVLSLVSAGAPRSALTDVRAAPARRTTLVTAVAPAIVGAQTAPSLEGAHQLLASGHVEAARQVYREAVASDASWADAQLYAGITSYLCGQFDDALQQLRAASFLEPELWPATYYLALCYETLGMSGEALREYRHVLRSSERRPDVTASLHPLFRGWLKDLLAVARERVCKSESALTPAPRRASSPAPEQQL